MIELLKKWAILEPKRCRPCEETGNLEVRIKQDEWCEVVLDDIITLDLMWIQWAIQEAITEKDWNFSTSLICYPHSKYWRAMVHKQSHPTVDNTGLVEVLLTAYLAALEEQS